MELQKKTNSTKSSGDAMAIVDPISSAIDGVRQVYRAIRQFQSPGSIVEMDEYAEFINLVRSSKMDHQLWKLILLFGETYLALGRCYIQDGQLHQALKVVESATLVHESMPEDTVSFRLDTECQDVIQMIKSLPSDCFSSTGLFWTRAWILVGDVYKEFHDRKMISRELPQEEECSTSSSSTNYDRPTRHGRNSMPKPEPVSKSSEESHIKGSDISVYLQGPPITAGLEFSISTSLICYENAEKVLSDCIDDGSSEEEKLLEKKGAAYFDLGVLRSENNTELDKTENSFIQSIICSRRVFNHSRVVRSYCKLGLARLRLADDISKEKVADAAKYEYCNSLSYYMTAKNELNALVEEGGERSSISNEVIPQLADIYMKLGILLGEKDTKAEIFLNKRKKVVSAEYAIKQAILLNESMDNKSEIGRGYMELGKYYIARCMKFNEAGILQEVEKYASLTQSNWKKCMEIWTVDTYPKAYLMILVQRVELDLFLSDHQYNVLETAFSGLLEARHLGVNTIEDSDRCAIKFWKIFREVLKKMLRMALSSSNINQASSSQQSSGDVTKLRQIYRMALTSDDFGQLSDIHRIWFA